MLLLDGLVVESPTQVLIALGFGVIVAIVVWRRLQALTIPRRLCASIGVLASALALGLFLSGVQEEAEIKQRAVLLLIDNSASLGQQAEQHARRTYQELRTSLPGDALLSVARYDKRYSELLPFAVCGEHPEQLPWPTTPPQDRLYSKLNSALQIASLSFPQNRLAQLVLISDGQSTNTATQLDLPCALLPMESQQLDDVGIESLNLKYAGQGVSLSITLASTRTTQASLELRIEQQLSKRITLDLQPGQTPLRVSIDAIPQDGGRLEAIVSSPDDRLIGNESLSLALAPRLSTPHILIVDASDDSRAGKQLEHALSIPGFNVTRQLCHKRAPDFDRIDSFDALFLVDISATQISEFEQRRLQAWVEAGGGIAMLGGPQSFALGGWYDSTLERLLPVTSRIERDEGEQLALVLVLDRSGSMGTSVGNGTKMDHANRGAILSMRLIMENDDFGVLSTDTSNEWIVPFQPLSDRREAERNLRKHSAGGGGIYLATALEEAYDALQKSDATNKHILLFADGSDVEEKGNWIVRAKEERQEHKIKLSAIAIGQGEDVGFLQELAAAAGGHCMVTENALNLPELFSSEAARIGGGYIHEEAFSPTIMSQGELNSKIDFSLAPPLLGHVATRLRDDARMWLSVDRQGETPLLATRRVGLGRSLAFTSDARDRWASEWLDWEGFSSFWQRSARWLAGPRGQRGAADLNSYLSGDTLRVELATPTRQSVTPTMLARDPQGVSQRIAMRQETPTLATASIPLSEKGLYRLSFWQENDGEILSLGEGLATYGLTQEARPSTLERAKLIELIEKRDGRVLPDGAAVAVWQPKAQSHFHHVSWPIALLGLIGLLALVSSKRFPSLFGEDYVNSNERSIDRLVNLHRSLRKQTHKPAGKISPLQSTKALAQKSSSIDTGTASPDLGDLVKAKRKRKGQD